VYYLPPSGSPGGKQFPIRINGTAQLRDIVSQHFPKSAGLEKVSLHVDDEKCAVLRIEFERVGFSVNAQSPIQLHGVDPCGQRGLKAWVRWRAFHMPSCVLSVK
jgi:hypothetical protein